MDPRHTMLAALERYALAALEKQDRLAGVAGDGPYDLLLDAGKVRFASGYEFSLQVLGTESDNTFTWLWAWAEEQTELHPNIVQTSLALREWGAREGVAVFTSPATDLDVADGNAIALIAVQVAQASCFFRDAYEGGAAYLLLFGEAIDRGPSFDRARLARHFTDIVARYEVDPRRTLRSYFTITGLPFAERGRAVIGTLATGEQFEAEFADDGRIRVICGEPVS